MNYCMWCQRQTSSAWHTAEKATASPFVARSLAPHACSHQNGPCAMALTQMERVTPCRAAHRIIRRSMRRARLVEEAALHGGIWTTMSTAQRQLLQRHPDLLGAVSGRHAEYMHRRARNYRRQSASAHLERTLAPTAPPESVSWLNLCAAAQNVQALSCTRL